MDKLLTVNGKKEAKHLKNKKKPLKVVYITNPIKVETSASEFRALVQELTGKYSEIPDSAKFAEVENVGHGQEEVVESVEVVEDHAYTAMPPLLGNPNGEKSDPAFGTFNNAVYTPQVVENFSELITSGLWHENPHDDVFKSLDAM